MYKLTLEYHTAPGEPNTMVIKVFLSEKRAHGHLTELSGSSFGLLKASISNGAKTEEIF